MFTEITYIYIYIYIYIYSKVKVRCSKFECRDDIHFIHSLPTVPTYLLTYNTHYTVTL